MKAVITGGTGLIGRALSLELLRAKHEVTVLSRNPARTEMPDGVSVLDWDGHSGENWWQVLDGDTVIINLAGEPVAGSGFLPSRWTPARKERILASRQRAAGAIVDAVQRSAQQTGSRPRALIQASAVGYYGPSRAGRVDEAHPAGQDFLAGVCVDWEAAATPLKEIGLRLAVARIGVVLAPEGGALSRQKLLFRWYLGGPLGSGEQGYPWIHIHDVTGALRFLMENAAASGPFNLTAPDPVSNAQFGRALGQLLHRPYWLPAPAFALRLAFGEVASILLDGQKAYPKRLLAAGYAFRYPQLTAALQGLTQAGTA